MCIKDPVDALVSTCCFFLWREKADELGGIYHTPPALPVRSKTVTSSPAALRWAAADTPDTPAPITAIRFIGWAISWCTVGTLRFEESRMVRWLVTTYGLVTCI